MFFIAGPLVFRELRKKRGRGLVILNELEMNDPQICLVN
jgi:hypothetical protein